MTGRRKKGRLGMIALDRLTKYFRDRIEIDAQKTTEGHEFVLKIESSMINSVDKNTSRFELTRAELDQIIKILTTMRDGARQC